MKAFGAEGVEADVLDFAATPGTTPVYWLRVTSRAGEATIFGPVEATSVLPSLWSVSPARPNPFNPTTSVILSVPSRGMANVAVYNLLGQSVKVLHSGPITAGRHLMTWNGLDMQGREMASGVYLIQLDTDNGIRKIRRITLLR